MSVFDPIVLLNEAPSVCNSLFGKLVCVLVGSKIISSSQSDKAYQNLLRFMNLACQKFNRHEQRLDEFL